ncbi:TPA: DapH/DapD/GlmU-related protein [Vibrio cholerae]
MFKKFINNYIRSKIILLEKVRGYYWKILIKSCGGTCGKNLRVGRDVKFKYGPSENIHIGDNVYIGDFSIIDVNHSASLNLGSNSYLSVGVFIAANSRISIGDCSLIAEYTSIRDHNHGIDLNQEVFVQSNVSEKIEIGYDVWIGRGCVVLKGVCIEDKCIVGANSVVNKDLNYASIAVGAPAKKIKARV